MVCRTGDVVVTDEDGREVHAIPGTAIERRAGRGFAQLAVGAADPDDFRKSWEDARISALKADTLPVIEREAVAYDRSLMSSTRRTPHWMRNGTSWPGGRRKRKTAAATWRKRRRRSRSC